ncbi:3-hydroxyacyl-ACP dehydratase FabZ [Alphaproteobacteria bacterium]|nr:3-hydroxyacyl-ACP dehydratase FabZ [Alphaproteobacteria bacterium]
MILKNDDGKIKVLLHNEIINLIPHRYPFLLIDKITDIYLGKSVTGIKSITFNEPFFSGHFPTYPVMPGVLILESMAQTAACLVGYGDKSLSKDNLVFFTGIEKAKFRKPVTPGCILNLKINIVTSKKSLYKFSGEAFVNDIVVASSNFSAMLVDQEKAL